VTGNPFIGLFAKTNDNITFVGNGASDRFIKHVDVLKTEIVRISVGASDLIGIYSVMNNKGILISSIIEEEEIKAVIGPKSNGTNIAVLDTKKNAIGNNVVANDYGAIVNPDFGADEISRIKDILGVEVVKSTIAGYKTVGSVTIATNSGFMVHPKASHEELEMISSLFHVQGGIGTANTGIPFIGISVIANKNGFVIGEATTGYESGRINDCLGFI